MPALRWLHGDLCVGLPGFTGFRGHWQSQLLAVQNQFAHVLSYRRPDRSVQQPHPDQSLFVDEPEGFVFDTAGYSFRCADCPSQFLTKRASHMHRVRAHHARRESTAHITSAYCPVCFGSFATVGSAQRHFLAVCSKRHVASDRGASPAPPPQGAGGGWPAQLGHVEPRRSPPQSRGSCTGVVPAGVRECVGPCHASSSSDLRLSSSGQGQGASRWAQADNIGGSPPPQAIRVRPVEGRSGRTDRTHQAQPHLGARQDAQHSGAAGDLESAHQGISDPSSHAARDSGMLLVQSQERRQICPSIRTTTSQSSSSDARFHPLLSGGTRGRTNLRIPAAQWSHEGFSLGDWRRQRQSNCPVAGKGGSAQVTLDHVWGRGAF